MLFKYKSTNRLKVKGWNTYHINTNKKKSGVAVITSMQILEKNIIKNKKSHFIMTIWSIHHGDILLLKFYVPNIQSSELIKQKTDRTVQTNI